MKFGLFFLSEYANMITASALITTLYLGGWQVPGLSHLNLPDFWVSVIQFGSFAVKVVALIVFFILIRWTIPRFRYDQLMKLGWKVMLPLSLLNVLWAGMLILSKVVPN